MAKEEIEFPEGLIVRAPHEKAPDFVKAQISIKVEDLGQWLRAKYKAGEEWVNLDVKVSKSGNWYAAVSTFKPKKQEEAKGSTSRPAKQTGTKFDDMNDDIPF